MSLSQPPSQCLVHFQLTISTSCTLLLLSFTFKGSSWVVLPAIFWFSTHLTFLPNPSEVSYCAQSHLASTELATPYVLRNPQAFLPLLEPLFSPLHGCSFLLLISSTHSSFPSIIAISLPSKLPPLLQLPFVEEILVIYLEKVLLCFKPPEKMLFL